MSGFIPITRPPRKTFFEALKEVSKDVTFLAFMHVDVKVIGSMVVDVKLLRG